MALSVEAFSQTPKLRFYLPDQAVRVDNHPPVRLDRRKWTVVNIIAAAGGKFVLKQELDTALFHVDLNPCTIEELNSLREMLTPPVIEIGGPDNKPHYWTDAQVELVNNPPHTTVPLHQIPHTWRNRARAMGITNGQAITGRGEVAIPTQSTPPAISPEEWLAANQSLLRSAAIKTSPFGVRPEDAEDGAQNGALAVWEHSKEFNPRQGSIESWAATIARNKTYDILRRNRTRRHAFEKLTRQFAEELRTGVGVIDVEEHVVNRTALAEIWNYLTPNERQFVPLIASGHTLLEISERLKWPLGTLKTRIQRMRLKMNQSQLTT